MKALFLALCPECDGGVRAEYDRAHRKAGVADR